VGRAISRLGLVCAALALAPMLAAAPVSVGDEPLRDQFLSLERAIQGDPENLPLAARYRALAIETAQFDRSIDFFEKIAKQKGSGPNVYISLALAYVDKVPPAGDIRRLFLGRDAMGALTKSIQQRPCALAYYLRGVINLYYNRRIFNRTERGLADLQKAVSMTTPETPPALVARIHTAIGDGQFRQGNLAQAREAWSIGAARFPDDLALRRRLEKQGQELDLIVWQTLAPERRADTSLIGLLPVP
jgi:tetratricopeptide (TPR) repeat protein